MTQPDARKTLAQLRKEWEGCTKCELGQRRQATSGSFVFGEGRTRGIMLIGEGPGRTEEQEGRPFIGKSGEILRRLLTHWKISDVYLTNLVTCRSCSPVLDADGLPRIGRNKMPMFRDEAPLPTHMEACRQRLIEEIYLVDPVVIVSLGGKAAEALLQKPVTITRDRGQEKHIEIPGASWRATFTEKRGAWLRKVGGQLVAPVEENTVTYLLIPTLHPAYVLREIHNDQPENPFRQFASDIKKAVKIYERYMLEVHGVEPRASEEEEGDISAMHEVEVTEDDEDDYYSE
jgi:uracil-DNA glycosylase